MTSATSPVSTPSITVEPEHESSASLLRSLSPLQEPSPTNISPRPSFVFVSRPSPIVPSPSVPASPSFSRPTSPRPSRDIHDEPSSPSGPHSDQHQLASASASAVDLNHIFERDVEYTSTHQLSTQEAVDVAIPSALDAASLASDDLSSDDIVSILQEVTGDAGSGWSSPIMAAPASHLHHGQHPYVGASRSPTRGSRSFSPDSTSSGRATSPESSASFSIGTPGSSPPSAVYAPFTHHLSEALESEARNGRKPTFALGGPPTPGTSTKIPFPSVSSSSTPSEYGGASGLPGISSSASMESLGADRRRLSFMSLADVINEERMAELTGTAIGEPRGGLS
ncbi:hypothetical protein P7C70_g2721, partial [Phenoliferia sp. Uapishka_3]